MIGKLWLQTCICKLFLIRHFVRTYTHNTETTGRMASLLLEMSIFCIRVECKIRLAWYGSKHASWSLSDKPFVPTYMLNLKTIQVVYEYSAYRRTALLSETFLVRFRVAWETQLKSYGTRHTLVILWYNIVCINCKFIHTLLFGTQLHTT